MDLLAKKTIMVVDDSSANIKIALIALGSAYKMIPFSNGREAIEYLKKGNSCSLILLDVEMPELDGFETIKQIKNIDAAKNIPVIFLTGKVDAESEISGLALGAADYIYKPMNPPLVKLRIDKHIKFEEYSNHLEHLVDLKTKTIEKLSDVVIFTVVSIVESRDEETGGHINRTSEYISTLAQSLISLGYFRRELSPVAIDMMKRSAPLHDIGKVGISDAILKKPGKLTDDEFEEMKKHTTIGGYALNEARKLMGEDSFLDVASPLALYHHEKWNGRGYPEGLVGEDIPLAARIMAIADVYDALISKRPYKKPFTHELARSIILEGSGTHFDPRLVEAFERSGDDFICISKKFD